MKIKYPTVIKKNQKGQAALVIVLITMFLLLFVSLALTNIIMKQVKMTGNVLFSSVQSYYLADAGRERVLYLKKTDSDLSANDPIFDEVISGIGSMKAIKTNDSPLTVEITGHHRNTARTMQLSW